MCHDWDRFYNETINGIEFVSYENRKSQKYVPVQLQIAPITKSPRAFAPYEKQKRRMLRTNTASYRIYNEIAEGIRALWKAERINAASDAFTGITKLHNLSWHSRPYEKHNIQYFVPVPLQIVFMTKRESFDALELYQRQYKM